MAAIDDAGVWFAKNSDREPGEAQMVEHIAARTNKSSSSLRCTYTEIPQTEKTFEVLLSRPFWMWGAEMGVNERGLGIGNEAVFTRLAVEKTGLTGMDLLRLALERASCAREAIEVITRMIALYGQGGGCGYRNRRFRYHNSFIIADHREAWALETVGPYWAAQRVRQVKTISNALSIGKEFDLVHDEAFTFARSQGWCRSAADFDFARVFGDPKYTYLSGGIERAACTLKSISKTNGQLSKEDFFSALRDHAGLSSADGWRMKMPCAHASWQPARRSGQTTSSMVARLESRGANIWMTGTSSPCLSVFKPVAMASDLLDTGPKPDGGYDSQSLFWRHERLHRLALKNYDERKAAFDEERRALEEKFASVSTDATNRDYREFWEKHREVICEWTSRVEKMTAAAKKFSPFQRYWARQAKEDVMP
ncbi:MAG: C69 family dipeptidase [Acidobacteriota bacterium]